MKNARRRCVQPPSRHRLSLAVLAALGALAVTPPAAAQGAGGALPARTLPVLRGVVSGAVTFQGPATGNAPSLLTITQADLRAVIDWRSFNISADSAVNFVHERGSSASTLNRIYSADPTIIQGRLSSVGALGADGRRGAGGQVILINQNGILFDRGSQVNAHSFVASTLNLSNERFNSGSLSSGGLTSPAFAGGYDDQGNTLPARPDGSRPGVIGIGSFGAATAAAPQVAAGSGGSILLFAPRIDNESGIITAPDGQVILAAGAKAYLALPADDDSSLRGLRVEVEAAGGNNLNLTNLIRNAGSLSADRGNVTLAALAVNQDGRVSASTAIQANGSVYLKARTLDGAQSGSVTLGAGSVTQVQPDANDTATLPESQAYADRRGEIRVEGRSITSQGTLLAAGGRIALTASDAADPSGARVYLDQGSVTSVAGHWADVAYASNLLTFKVTSNELKDAPDQKTGVLKGATVTVDLRKGSPLLDLSGYVAAQARTVAEKTAVGGDLQIESTGSLIQRRGATLDASGGGYRYGGGTAATSQLLGDDGKTYSITSAPEQRRYTALLDTYTRNDARWNQPQVYTGLLYGIGATEAGYLEGKAGGSIRLNAAAGLVLDGTLAGGVTVGPNQLAAAPRGATLTIGNFSTPDNDFASSQRIGNIGFVQRAGDTLGSAFTAASPLSAAQRDNVTLGAEQLFGGGSTVAAGTVVQTAFDSVEINSNGRIVLPAGVAIEGAAGSSLSLRAPQIDIGGTIGMPAGNITLLPQATVNPLSADLGVGHDSVHLRGEARLSTAGVWINNATADGSFLGDPLPSARQNVGSDGSTTTTSMLNGGTVTISAGDGTSATLLEAGSSIDVGGGASLSAARKLGTGNGGKVVIANGLSNALASDWLQSDLSGLSPGKGGSLSISTPRVEIAAEDANGLLPANTTRLTPGLFAEHGFADIAVTATAQGLAVNAGADLVLRQKNLVVDPVAAAQLASGGDLRGVAAAATLPDDQRPPMTLKLNAKADPNFGGQATLTMAQGASIVADPLSQVSMSAVDRLSVDGRIVAPGGSVSLSLGAPIDGAPDLTLGAHASISVAATFVRKPADSGLVQGRVIDAGSIAIGAAQAGVDLVAGSQLNLNGLVQTVQTAAADGSGRIVEQAIDGHAGTLLIRSQGRTQLDATLHAERGSAQGAGGSFVLELTSPLPNAAQPTFGESRIVVTQATAAAVDAAAGAAVAVDALQQAGFQKLRLLAENTVELRGDVAMTFDRGIRFDAPLIDVTQDGRVALRSASSVALGQSLDPRNSFGVTEQQALSPVLATRAGQGLLSASAGTIDLFGSTTVNGVAETRLASAGDIRLTGRNVAGVPDTDRAFGRAVGSLTTEGNLVLDAAQVYPTTRSDFTLSVAQQPGGAPVAGGFVQVVGNGATAGDVYSAGGKLTVVADVIVQGGTLKAPLGGINLQAGQLLDLAPGSLTSVSADGLTIPFGFTRAGLDWSYQDNRAGGTANLLATGSADAKRIGLIGKTVNLGAGATVDLSGGGDLQAAEFVGGSGGSVDTFSKPNTYAIIPKSQLGAMPVDTDTATRYATDTAGKASAIGFQSTTGDSNLYDSLHIGAGGVVPAGDYVLLPGRYALLPGAYLVQLQTGSAYSGLQPGQTSALVNGQTVVAGYRLAAGTGIRESLSIGVVVRPGSAALTESDYTVSTAAYFSDLASRQRSAAPRLPADAGRLAISVTDSLALSGRVDSTPGDSSGRSAEIDISADRIAVVDRVGSSDFGAGTLQIDGAQLSSLGGSLLLGGLRSGSGGVEQITTTASDIVVANSAAGALHASEVVLVANNSIDVRAGSVISGSGSADAGTKTLQVSDGGALLRVATGAQALVDRGATVDNTRGDLRVAAGATLSASGALLLDATRSTQSQGRLDVTAGGSVSLASSLVSLGATAGVAGIGAGLVLSNADLAGLASLDALVLKGYQGIDLYGSATIGGAALGSLTLDAPALRGHGDAVALSNITADTVRLVNRGAGPAAVAPATAGALTVAGQRIVVDAGDKTVSGFTSVTMAAGSELRAEGRGTLNVAGDWVLSAPQVVAASGSVQSWRAADDSDAAHPVYSRLTLEGGSGTAGASDAGAGGRLALAARSIAVASTVTARSGSISLAALGSDAGDGVTLAPGALLDASGLALDFRGHAVVADAGSVALSAAAGTVALQAGSSIALSASAQGGNAGSLSVQAEQLAPGGSIAAHSALGGLGGRAALDLGQAADLSALAQTFGSAGFDAAIDLRLRRGDLHLAAGDTLRARQIQLAADSGRIDIAGTLDASSARGGGTVSLWAGDGIALQAGSRIDAYATAGLLSSGGKVRITTNGGALDFDSASTIDVGAGAKGRSGSVTFGVARDANNQIAPVHLAGTVKGGSGSTDAEVVLEAQRSYRVGDTLDIAGYAADHAAFVGANSAADLLGGVRNGSGQASNNTALHGATEIVADGDINLVTGWDLTGAAWLANGQPGTLTLRAAGNLTIGSALGSPNDDIVAGQTWGLRLVGGADLAAANPLAVQRGGAASGQGSVVLAGNEAKVRTGTGTIDVAAAADFRMTGAQSVVYTAGRIGAADTEAAGNNRWGVDGGAISVFAGRDAVGASDEWITEWLRRPRVTTGAPEWWAYRPNFQQGLGTLGGGDIGIVAGRDVDHLSAMLPTTARSVVDAAGQRGVDVQGGGDLMLRAGNDVIGGSYLVARGSGAIAAAGAVGGNTPTQLYLMGASSGDVPAQAGVSIAAGAAIALQSVNNPTAVYQDNSAGSGPSFPGPGSTQIVSFFSYADDSAVHALAKSGDVTLGTKMADARGFRSVGGKPVATTRSDTTLSAAYPASVDAVALAGDVTLNFDLQKGRTLYTYPSPSAAVALLAQGAVLDPQLAVSDRLPQALQNVDNFPYDDAKLYNVGARQLSGDDLRATADGRLVNRAPVSASGGYAIDIQALDGRIGSSSANGNSLYLPAASRVRAGDDISGLSFALQNLDAGDLSIVRSDNGDVLPLGLQIGGPGRLLVQAGRNVDVGTAAVFVGSPGVNIGGLIAIGSSSNPSLKSGEAARMSLVAGVKGDVDLAAMDKVYADVIALNTKADAVLAFYRALNGDPDRSAVLAAADIKALAARDAAYQPYVDLVTKYPQVLALYQQTAKAGTLPLGAGDDARQAAALYALLNRESDRQAIIGARSVADLVASLPDGAAYQAFVALDAKYPLVFADYRQRRSKGGLAEGLTPILFSGLLKDTLAQAVSADAVGSGSLYTFQSSIQSYGNGAANGQGSIDLWAPGGGIVAGLTTPSAGSTIGVLTNAGGAVRSVVRDDFSINQGKVLTAQGGDILIYSIAGSIDAGRGARTSISTPPPKRTAVVDPETGTITGYTYTLPAGASGSGIQSLTSDPDGLGPLAAPPAGSIYLAAPGGTIDAGEAGIRSGGNIVIVAQTVRNADAISAKGSAQGVPKVETGSVASSLASSGAAAGAAGKAAEEAAANSAARAPAATAPVAKPTILSVEVLGFGDKNCKEDDKDCFAK